MNRYDRTRKRLVPIRRAFTLIEVLLVIVIIGMLATVLVVTIGGTREGAQIDTTKIKVQQIANAIERYAMDVGHYPNEGEGGIDALHTKPNFDNEDTTWHGYAQVKQLTDAWGSKLNYELLDNPQPGQPGFRIWSNGPDQQGNNEDDIIYPENSDA